VTCRRRELIEVPVNHGKPQLRDAMVAAIELSGCSLQVGLAVETGAALLGEDVDPRGLALLLRTERSRLQRGAVERAVVTALVARTPGSVRAPSPSPRVIASSEVSSATTRVRC